jgi:hypothetical protein
LRAAYYPDEFIAISWYTSGVYAIPEGQARYPWYGFTGTPSVMFDGYDFEIGGLTSGSMFPYYDPIVSSHQGNAPLAITAAYGLIGVNGSLNVHIEVTDAVATTSNYVHFVIVEDGVHGQENLARDMLADEAFTLTAPGQTVDIIRNFTLDPTWNADDIAFVVFVQSHSGNKQVLQAAYALPDYAATVIISPEPELLLAPWALAGPNGYLRDGVGAATLPVWSAGDYTVTWEAVTGWSSPSPAQETQTVSEGGTITFTATYTGAPFTGLTAGSLGDAGPGRGVSMIDFDKDGDLDITVVNYNAANLLLRNEGGDTFVDVATGLLADTGPDNAAIWADYDNDGDWDLYLSKDGAANLLIRNDGAGLFTDATSFGLDNDGPGCGVAWADYNNDGLIDLYLANNGAENKLFKSFGPSGDQWFFFSEGGAVDDIGPGCGASWADFNNDGRPDLYLTNRFAKNLLFENSIAGFFESGGAGALANINNGAGAAWADFDRDGDLDCYLANDGNPDVLAINSGFFSPNLAANLSDTGHGKAVVWGDFDNDADEDLYVARAGQPDLYLRNDGPTDFKVIPLAVAGTFGNAAGAACGDYDDDGDLDVYIANDGEPNVLLRNECSNGNHWLKVDLVGVMSNASAVGARVRVVTGPWQQMREIACGSGYYSQNAPTAHFGLWFFTSVDTLEVTWPKSGRVQTFVGLAADQRLVIPEDVSTGIDDGVSTPVVFRLHPPYPNPFNPLTTIKYDLPAAAAVTLSVYDLSGKLVCSLRRGELETMGTHRVVWEGVDDGGKSVASGTYFCKLEAGEERAIQRLMMIK